MTEVLLATCTEYAHGVEDEQALTGALARLGLRARWAVWDDPAVRWDDALVVLRSTWDYTPRRAEFLAWTRGLPRLVNPAEVVAWSSDKTYLRDLADAGVAIVPTFFAAPGDHVDLPPAGEVVVKPSVGAGSRGAGRFTPDRADAARAHAGALHRAGRTVLVQPHLGDVDAAGESALIYLDGRFSHSVTKASLLPPGTVHEVGSGELFVPEYITPHVPTDDELALGGAALAAVQARFGSAQTYARVDLLPSSEGPLLLELELVEPSLFLDHDPQALDRLAAAIAARA